MFDTDSVMTVYELETLRRSAAMAALPKNDVDEVIRQCIQLQRERQQIVEMLGRLPESVTALRETLNALHRLVRSPGRP